MECGLGIWILKAPQVILRYSQDGETLPRRPWDKQTIPLTFTFTPPNYPAFLKPRVPPPGSTRSSPRAALRPARPQDPVSPRPLTRGAPDPRKLLPGANPHPGAGLTRPPVCRPRSSAEPGRRPGAPRSGRPDRGPAACGAHSGERSRAGAAAWRARNGNRLGRQRGRTPRAGCAERPGPCPG